MEGKAMNAPSNDDLRLVSPTACQLATALANLRHNPGLDERDTRLLELVIEFLDKVSVGDLRCPEMKERP